MHHKNIFFFCIYSHKNNNNKKKNQFFYLGLCDRAKSSKEQNAFHFKAHTITVKEKNKWGKKLRKVCVYGHHKPITQDTCRNTLLFGPSLSFLSTPQVCFCENFFLCLFFFLGPVCDEGQMPFSFSSVSNNDEDSPNLSQIYLMLQAIN